MSRQPAEVLYLGTTWSGTVVKVYAEKEKDLAQTWLGEADNSGQRYLWRVRLTDVVELAYFKPEPYLFEVAKDAEPEKACGHVWDSAFEDSDEHCLHCDARQPKQADLPTIKWHRAPNNNLHAGPAEGCRLTACLDIDEQARRERALKGDDEL